MSKRQTLRGFVNERLAAAANEIFVLVERTITEYEEELCRFKEENRRKQQLLDLVLRSQAPGPSAEVHAPVLDHVLGPDAAEVQTECISQKKESSETLHTQVKEEPLEKSIKQEEGQFPEFTVCYVESEEQTSLRHTQPEPKDPQGEDKRRANSSSNPHGYVYSEYGQSDSDPSAHSSTTQHNTFTVEEDDHSNKIQTKYRNAAAHYSAQGTSHTSAPETSGIPMDENMSSVRVKKPFQCFVCRMAFKSLGALLEHKIIHKDENPSNICFVCNKIFSKPYYLKTHMRIHTGERPYSCSVCHKSFTQKSALDIHERIHTGEKPYGCSICHRKFKESSSRIRHMRVHTREQPYSCLICGTSFSSNSNLKRHLYNSRTCISK